MPEISVIIPVYNAEKYLSSCLDSVLNQTFSDIEIICVDDCSTDASPAILEEYCNKDSRIRILRNAVNLRAADTRNVGLDNARGKYIYFIDADDYIDSGYLEELHAVSEKTGADIVMNINIRTDTDGKIADYVHPPMPKLPDNGGYLSNAVAIEQTFCVVWMRLFKRQFLEDYQIRFQRVNMTEDNVFHFMTNVNASSIYAFRGKYAYNYVLHNDSVTGIVKANNQRDYVTMKANDIIYDYLSSHGLLGKTRARVFSVLGFFKVDTDEKFELYKSFFTKIEAFLRQHEEDYNELDLFFADAVLSADSLEDYLSRHPVSVGMAYIKNKNKKI